MSRGTTATEVRKVKVDLPVEKLVLYRKELADFGIAEDELRSRREGLMKDIKVNNKEQQRVLDALKYGEEETEETDTAGRRVLRALTAERRAQLEARNADLCEQLDDLTTRRGVVMKELKVNEEEQAKRRKAIKHRAEEVELECEWRPDYEAGRSELINPLTGESIGESRPLTDEERQMEFAPGTRAKLRKANKSETAETVAGWMSPEEQAEGIASFKAQHGEGGEIAQDRQGEQEPCGFCGLPWFASVGLRGVLTLDPHSTSAYPSCPAVGLTRLEALGLRVVVDAQQGIETDELIAFCREKVERMTAEELAEITQDVTPPVLAEEKPAEAEPEVVEDKAEQDTRFNALLEQFCEDGPEKLKPAQVGKVMSAAAAAGMGPDGEHFRGWLLTQKLPGLTRKRVMAWDIGKGE